MTLSRFMKKPAKEETKVESAQATEDPDKIDPKVELDLLSKVVKTGSVETFEWRYKEKSFIKGKPTEVQEWREVLDVQAILINPKWADHGFDPERDTELGTTVGSTS